MVRMLGKVKVRKGYTYNCLRRGKGIKAGLRGKLGRGVSGD